MQVHYALFNRLNSDNFYTFFTNFYLHHKFYNILLARQNAYKLDRQSSARCSRLRIYTVAFALSVACVLQFQ